MPTISEKPHHLLDTIRLYGSGINHFFPDLIRHHDFDRVGRFNLTNPSGIVRLTVGSDDICRPCRFNQDHHCIDSVAENPQQFKSKEVWNRTIDKRLLDALGLQENDEITVLAFCQTALLSLNDENIKQIWQERPAFETSLRTIFLLRGLNKYVQSFQA
jgi:hypothetical protein